MATRASLTLLVIFPRQIVRADFGKGSPPTLIGTWEKPRPATEELPGLVELCIRLGPQPANKVWVISSDLWIQSVGLARNAVEGVAEDELKRALSFEAEPLSGMGAFDSELGYRTLPSAGSERAFLITQVETLHRVPLEDIISREGGRFAGLTSTAALPLPLFEAEEDASWQRIELWAEQVTCINAVAGQSVDVHVINDPPRQGRWRSEVDAWLNTVGDASHQEWLAGGDMSDLIEEDQPEALHLDDEETLEIWLSVWASYLSQPKPELAALTAKRQPISAKQKAVICITIWVIVAALVGLRWMMLKDELKEAQDIQQSAKAFSAQLAPLRKQESNLKRDNSDLKKEVDELLTLHEHTEGVLALYRDRHAALLELLRQYASDSFQVYMIRSSSGNVTLGGASTDANLINQLGAELSEKLRPYGWHAALPTKEGRGIYTNGGPWDFTIEIKDAGPPQFMLEGEDKR